MEFRTKVSVGRAPFSIRPCCRMLFVGSCFADSMGRCFTDDRFRAVVNPFGVMYNPASVLHTVERYEGEPPEVAVLTLGTNHVYILKETGEIVDNCRKRPQRLFREELLTVDVCLDYLSRAVETLLSRNPDVRVVVTVSPIRYAKYGFHGSALSKAVLLLAADRLAAAYPDVVEYFPAYEIVNDELRDYRFYAEDMLHPSQQAVAYIWERFAEAFFSEDTWRFLEEWRPIKEALAHRPFRPDSDEYKEFLAATMRKAELLARKYPDMEWDGKSTVG
ncbi:GSCFA domain-containing protein [Leyella lascolaii]|uniref:GSCFA domain-containing protein n=1 Tax=Leyella lascolaii TaxID=1776379 RepID=A0AAW7JQJ9_9BACT|nr:GSCFA domain-containing protein [Leyella lascolaii]MDN0023090.1 GSCFA domain-containing protein [Leyella lascolaii]MDN0025165.1 GSCFA domain-containing protein [Leyella lascolaii]